MEKDKTDIKEINTEILDLLPKQTEMIELSDLEDRLKAVFPFRENLRENIIDSLNELSKKNEIDIEMKRIKDINKFYIRIKIKKGEIIFKEPAEADLPRKGARKSTSQFLAILTAIQEHKDREMKISDLSEKANKNYEGTISEEVLGNVLKRLEKNEMLKIFSSQTSGGDYIKINNKKIRAI